MSRFGLALALCAGLPVLAQARPTLAVVPLELDPNPALTRFEGEVRAAFYSAVFERSGALVPSKKENDAAVRETKREDFRQSDEALARVAAKAGTLYALHATLEYTATKQLQLAARVVREDGKLVKRTHVQMAKGSDTIVGVVGPLTMQLLAQLELGALPVSKESSPIEVPKADAGELPPPPPPPPLVTSKVTPMKIAAYSATGAGALTAVFGGILYGVGSSQAPSVRQDGNGNVYPGYEQTYLAARSNQSAGLGLLIGGVAAAAGGVVLLVLSADEAPVSRVGVAPLCGGAVVVVGGSLP